jgi:very-short-patch-repair endonuclease
MGQRVDREHVQRAKELRAGMTRAEAVLWERVRRNGLHGLHFRRQQLIDGFIADFYCHAARLVVEIDGEVHDERQGYDTERTELFQARGLAILRFTNEEVFRNLDGTLEIILRIALDRVLARSALDGTHLEPGFQISP